MVTLDLPPKRTPRAAKPARVRSVWGAAAQSRLTADWFATMLSANEELRWDLLTLRRRARQQERDNPHVRRYFNLLVKNVVGASGIRLDVKTTTTRGAPHTGPNGAIETAWREWGRPASCTVDGSLGWVGVQAMALANTARDGEVFVRMLEGFNNPFGFALQFIDPDQLDQNYSVTQLANGGSIVMSVERDKWGRTVAYHVWDRHPSEAAIARTRERIPAEQIIHVKRPSRYGAARAETWLAPMLMTARHLAGFIEAAVINARVGAGKMGFIEKTGGPDFTTDPESISRDTVMEAAAGSIEELEPGETFKSWDPAFPSEAFDPFNTALLHYMAAGMDVSGATLTADYSAINYSSLRGALLDERDTYRQLQGWLIEQLIDPIYRAWLKMAVTTGAVALPAKDLTRWYDVQWRPRGWGWIDPQKEVLAAGLAESMGYATKTQLIADRGGDIDSTLAEFVEERMKIAALGLVFDKPNTLLPQESPDDNSDGAVGTRHAPSRGHAAQRGPLRAVRARG